MSGMPHFAGGIGDFLSGAWEAVKGFTGDVFDYLKNPGEIVKIALDKFVGLGDFFEPWLSIAGGIVELVHSMELFRLYRESSTKLFRKSIMFPAPE